MFFNTYYIYFLAIQMADEGGVKKYSEKLFKRVKVSRCLKIHIGI